MQAYICIDGWIDREIDNSTLDKLDYIDILETDIQIKR